MFIKYYKYNYLVQLTKLRQTLVAYIVIVKFGGKVNWQKRGRCGFGGNGNRRFFDLAKTGCTRVSLYRNNINLICLNALWASECSLKR